MALMCAERFPRVPAGTSTVCAAHMVRMPKKTKTPEPEPIRPELADILKELLHDRGLVSQDWPADEAAAYRDNGGFLEGRGAVQQLRMAKAAATIEDIFAEAIRAAEMKGYLEGIDSAQAMTGFSDETFRSILDKDGHAGIDLDGSAL